MPCTRCRQPGHNRRTCRAVIQPVLPAPVPDVIPAPSESQATISSIPTFSELFSTNNTPLNSEENVSVESIPSEPIVEIVSSPEDEPEPEFSISVPELWNNTDNYRTKRQRILLRENSTEYIRTLKKFAEYFSSQPTIISIKRLQDPVKIMQYQLEKQRMAMRDNCPIEYVKELTLYHGTSSSSVNSINKNGFNRTFGNIQAYGDGIYFARNAEMSADTKYAKPDEKGHQVIYVTKVLVGHSALGRGGMKIPPDRKPGIPYDSLVNCLNSPTIFVSGHNDNQMYAEYLVEFKLREPTVSRFGRQVGHLEIQNMDSCQYELYWVPNTYKHILNRQKHLLIRPEIMKNLKKMISVARYSKSYQSIGSIGDDFIIVRKYKPTVQGNRIVSPNNYLNFVGHISYKDNPHKKMSVAIIQGSLVHL